MLVFCADGWYPVEEGPAAAAELQTSMERDPQRLRRGSLQQHEHLKNSKVNVTF